LDDEESRESTTREIIASLDQLPIQFGTSFVQVWFRDCDFSFLYDVMPELADSAQYASMDLKDRGNQWFSEKKYDQALACYSDAIVSPIDTKYQASINYVCVEQHVHGDEGIPNFSLVPSQFSPPAFDKYRGESLGDLVSWLCQVDRGKTQGV